MHFRLSCMSPPVATRFRCRVTTIWYFTMSISSIAIRRCLLTKYWCSKKFSTSHRAGVKPIDPSSHCLGSGYSRFLARLDILLEITGKILKRGIGLELKGAEINVAVPACYGSRFDQARCRDHCTEIFADRGTSSESQPWYM